MAWTGITHKASNFEYYAYLSLIPFIFLYAGTLVLLKYVGFFI